MTTPARIGLAALVVAGLLATAGVAASSAITLVVCAPGYPGDTGQAQETMDGLAAGVGAAAGLPAGRLSAVYHERLEAGLDRLAKADAGLALLPLSLFLEQRDPLRLVPLAELSPQGVEAETWSLVAKRGAIEAPQSLAGWRIAGLPGYSPRFVRRVALAGFGELPPDVTVEPTGRVLAALREAASGAPVAVLLDAGQAKALSSLPFAADLEVVHRSDSLPSSLLCRVGDRISADEAERVARAFDRLDESEAGRELLSSIRVAAVRPIVPDRLRELGRAFDGQPSPTR